MTAFSTDFSLANMLETPFKDFKAQLSPLKPEQIDLVVKGWLEECRASKSTSERAEELITRVICVLPASSQKHFETLAKALGLDPNSERSFSWRMMILQNSDLGRRQLASNYSLDLECVSDVQLELLSLEYALQQGSVPTAEEFKALLRPELLDCRTPAGKDILRIMYEKDIDGLDALAQPLVDYYLEALGVDVFARRILYWERWASQFPFDSLKSRLLSFFGDTIAEIEKHKPLGMVELWEKIQNDFDYEAPYWHYRYDYLVTDSIPKAESRLQEELNILAVLLADSRNPRGRELGEWPKILEGQTGELRSLLKEELLDVRSSRNIGIYGEVLHYGSLKDIEQLLTFVHEKRGHEGLEKFVQGHSWRTIWFIYRGVGIPEEVMLERAKQLVALYQKLGLDPKTFIFDPEAKYEDLLSRSTSPLVLDYLLKQLTREERYEACLLRGADILNYGNDYGGWNYALNAKLSKIIYSTGVTEEELIGRII